MAGAVAQRAVLAVAGDRAVDEPGVLLAQALVAHAEAIEHAGAEGLQHDVVLARQAQEDLAPAVGLQIDADGGLVAVQGQEQRARGRVLRALVLRRRPPHVVAQVQVLDLQHLGAEVGQQQRAESAREQPREIEDLHAFQREAHAATRRGTPSMSRASATVAGRRPTSCAIWRALAMRSPLERAMVPSGR